MRLLFALPFLVLLTACDPSFMPAGYRYYQDDYKAPTGPDAPSPVTVSGGCQKL